MPPTHNGMQVVCPNPACGQHNLSWWFHCWQCGEELFDEKQRNEEPEIKNVA